MSNADARDAVSMMETVNQVIDGLHRSLGLADTDFFCECGHIGCKERLTLTRGEYAALQDRRQLVLVEAHAHRRADTLASVHDIRAGRSEAAGLSTWTNVR